MTNIIYAALAHGPEDEKGVYRTETGGSPWQRISSGITDPYVSAVAVDPRSPDVVCAGTWHGNVFQSTDGDDSWNQSDDGVISNTD